MRKKYLILSIICIIVLIICLCVAFFFPSFSKNGFTKDEARIPNNEIETSVDISEDDMTPEEIAAVNDTYFSKQKKAYELMGVSNAWKQTKGNHKVTIAVLDSGCNYTLKDLKDNLNLDLAYDVYNDCKLTEASKVPNGDIAGHGTQVCSVISAVADNNFGLAGVSYNAEIIPIKIANNTDDGGASFADMEKAYKYLFSLLDEGKIDNLAAINISYCGKYYYQGLQDSINKMYNDYGVVTVAAAGNDGTCEEKTYNQYPSDMDNVLSVEAVDDEGKFSSFTSWNENKDIAAFGNSVPVIKSNNKNEYSFISGTSFASPAVAGMVGLLKAYKPSLSCDEIVNLFKETATPIYPSKYDHENDIDGCVGVANVKNALNVLLTENNNFKEAEFSGLEETYYYCGKKIKPQVNVFIGDKKISKKNYSISYKNNDTLGAATITAKGKGKYKGSIEANFSIKPYYDGKISVKQKSKKSHTYNLSWTKYKGVGKIVKYYIKEYSYDYDGNNIGISSYASKDLSEKSYFDNGVYRITVKAKISYGGKTWYTNVLKSKKFEVDL